MNRAPQDQSPDVSVVIPVRNGEAAIADCIDAVLAAEYPAERREILVVDNGSTDGTAELVRARPVRYLHEPRRGVSNARNRGIAESTGDVIAFLDADCIPEARWLSELMQPFADVEVGSVAGDLRHAPPTNAAERQAVRLLGEWQQFAFSSDPAYAVTANAAYRRDVLERIGTFDPHMTRAQDVELGLRFQEQSGMRLALAERATARHRNRPTQRGFFRQQLGWAYGAGLVGAKYGRIRGVPARPTPPKEIARTGRGLLTVTGLYLRGRGERRWIEDAWFDLLRQIAWVVGMRAGMHRGARIWRIHADGDPG